MSVGLPGDDFGGLVTSATVLLQSHTPAGMVGELVAGWAAADVDVVACTLACGCVPAACSPVHNRLTPKCAKLSLWQHISKSEMPRAGSKGKWPQGEMAPRGNGRVGKWVHEKMSSIRNGDKLAECVLLLMAVSTSALMSLALGPVGTSCS